MNLTRVVGLAWHAAIIWWLSGNAFRELAAADAQRFDEVLIDAIASNITFWVLVLPPLLLCIYLTFAEAIRETRGK